MIAIVATTGVGVLARHWLRDRRSAGDPLDAWLLRGRRARRGWRSSRRASTSSIGDSRVATSCRRCCSSRTVPLLVVGSDHRGPPAVVVRSRAVVTPGPGVGADGRRHRGRVHRSRRWAREPRRRRRPDVVPRRRDGSDRADRRAGSASDPAARRPPRVRLTRRPAGRRATRRRPRRHGLRRRPAARRSSPAWSESSASTRSPSTSPFPTAGSGRLRSGPTPNGTARSSSATATTSSAASSSGGPTDHRSGPVTADPRAARRPAQPRGELGPPRRRPPALERRGRLGSRGGTAPAATRPARRPRPGVDGSVARDAHGGAPARPFDRSGSNTPPRELLERLADEIDSVVAELKRIVRDLRPTALDQLGLVGALAEFTRKFDGDLEIHLALPADPIRSRRRSRSPSTAS